MVTSRARYRLWSRRDSTRPGSDGPQHGTRPTRPYVRLLYGMLSVLVGWLVAWAWHADLDSGTVTDWYQSNETAQRAVMRIGSPLALTKTSVTYVSCTAIELERTSEG